MLAVPRIVSATLVERFIFNFRLPPDQLNERLPATWLKPHVLNGHAVASFCVLALDRLTLWPIPPLVRYRTISCAYRCGATDTSGPDPQPTVYITDRNTDRPLISRLGPLIFSDSIPPAFAQIARSPGTIEISVSHADGQRLFSADVHDLPAGTPFESRVFSSLDEFVAFIKGGVSSWTPSVKRRRLARVDLAKEDVAYEPMRAHVDFSSLESLWRDADLELDSAVRATGGRYRWTYRGLAPADR